MPYLPNKRNHLSNCSILTETLENLPETSENIHAKTVVAYTNRGNVPSIEHFAQNVTESPTLPQCAFHQPHTTYKEFKLWSQSPYNFTHYLWMTKPTQKVSYPISLIYRYHRRGKFYAHG